MTKRDPDCLEATPREILEHYGKPSKFMQDTWEHLGFIFVDWGNGEWGVTTCEDAKATEDGALDKYETKVSEAGCGRILYALGVMADDAVIRETLEFSLYETRKAEEAKGIWR